MGHRACVRMVKIIMGTTHVDALSDRAASLEPVERAATSEPRSMWRHLCSLCCSSHARDRNRQLSAWD